MNKLTLAIASLIITQSAFAQASSDNHEFYLNVSQSNVSFDWSIDNSSVGGIEKASEIKWNTDVNIVSAGIKKPYEQYELFFGKSGSGSMNDKDWEEVSSSSETRLYSDTDSHIDYSTIGFKYSNYIYRFDQESIKKYVNLDVYSNYLLQYEEWRAYGLHSNLTGVTTHSYNTKSMGLDSYWFGVDVGASLTKVLERHTFNVKAGYHVGTGYIVDHHYLRSDLKDDSFIIHSMYHGLQLEGNYAYAINDVLTLNAGYSLKEKKAFNDTFEVNMNEGGKVGAGLNQSNKRDESVYVGLSYKY